MRRLVPLVVSVALLAAAAPAVAQIPPGPRDSLLESFTGAAVKARPLPPQHIPQHPYMARNGGSNLHNDAYQSDAYNQAGPLGDNLKVTSTAFLQDCGSGAFDHGRG